MTYADRIKDGADRLGWRLEKRHIDQLNDYLLLLNKWNKAYNLTAVRDPDAMVVRHILDSMTVFEPVKAMDPERILDVGTGPGLPGIPLAICFPDKPVTLLDSNSKKTRFLNQCQIALNLPNIEVIHSRAEDFRPSEGFDLIVSRAFTALENMWQWCHHLLSPKGYFLAMKGQYPHEEIESIAHRCHIERTIPVQVPGLEAERHLVLFRPL